MRFLLIGGSGFIGPHVVSALERGGHDVVVFHRGQSTSAARHEIIGDRRALAEHAHELRAARPDVVVDLILSSGRQAHELMDIFRGKAARVVALSSCDVYRACGILHGTEPGPLQPVPLTETSELRTVLRTYPPHRAKMLQQVFGWLDEEYDKIPVEQEILSDAQLPGTVLRLPMVYGPGDPLRELIEEIREAALRAGSLTRQLLAFSRKQVLVPLVFDLNKMVREMQKVLGRVIGENIELVQPTRGRPGGSTTSARPSASPSSSGPSVLPPRWAGAANSSCCPRIARRRICACLATPNSTGRSTRRGFARSSATASRSRRTRQSAGRSSGSMRIRRRRARTRSITRPRMPRW